MRNIWHELKRYKSTYNFCQEINLLRKTVYGPRTGGGLHVRCNLAITTWIHPTKFRDGLSGNRDSSQPPRTSERPEHQRSFPPPLHIHGIVVPELESEQNSRVPLGHNHCKWPWEHQRHTAVTPRPEFSSAVHTNEQLIEKEMKITAFLNIALYSVVEEDRRFRGIYCLHHQDEMKGW
jgi:hypothetical protein